MRLAARLVAVVFLCLAGAGCATATLHSGSSKPTVTPTPAPAIGDLQNDTTQMASSLQPDEHEYGVMTVLFATSRELLASQPGQPAFGAKRAAQITYGSCDVSIPRDHRMGALESPTIWRFEFRPDPNEHIVMLGTKIKDKDRFFADLAARAAKDGKRSTFLFVHGYNVSFEDAARRTAQIAYDLGFKGAPVFYSWPSEGKEAAYMADEQAVEWAESGLRRFLSDYLNARGVDNVYIIAHSIG